MKNTYHLNFFEKNFFLLSFLILLIPSISFTQVPTYSWAKHFGTVTKEVVLSSVVDDSGNVYSTGIFEGTVDFDPGNGTFNLSAVHSNDVFITKTSSEGELIWAKQIGGTDDENVYSITLDKEENIIVCGTFKVTTDLDPGSNTDNVVSSGEFDIFIVKLDNDGNYLFGKHIGSATQEFATDVYCDNQNNVLIVGMFSNTTDFDPGSGTSNITPISNSDVYVLKLNSNGDFIWAKNVGGVVSTAWSVVCDDANNVVICGIFKDSIDCDPGLSNQMHYSNGFEDAFILKLDANGDYEWSHSLGGSGNDHALAVVVTDNNEFIIGGHFEDTVDLNPSTGNQIVSSKGFSDCFMLKLSNSGSFVWARHFGGADSERISTLTFDEKLGIMAIGSFYGVVDIDPSTTNVHNVVSNGQNEIFISAYYPSNGNFSWGVSVGGAHSDNGISVGADAMRNVYVTGSFVQTADFDPSTTTQSLTSNGDQDAFILKLTDPYLSVNNIDESDQFTLYPNPTSDVIFIDMGKVKNAIVTLVALDGRQIDQIRTGNSQNFQYRFPENIDSGVYLITIESNDHIRTEKIQLLRN